MRASSENVFIDARYNQLHYCGSSSSSNINQMLFNENNVLFKLLILLYFIQQVKTVTYILLLYINITTTTIIGTTGCMMELQRKRSLIIFIPKCAKILVFLVLWTII